MTHTESHPDLIAWVAGAKRRGAGGGGAEQEAGVAAHLAGCATCRAEVDSLTSLRRSLRAAEGPHLSVETLVALEAAGTDRIAAAPVDESAAHLARCAECRGDLEALRRADRARTAGGPAPLRGDPDRPARQTASADRDVRPGGTSTGWRRRIGWAAAAGIAAAGLALLLRPGHAPEAVKVVPGADDVIDFSAPARGGAGVRVLAGGGPATVRAALPFGSEGGAYQARLEWPDGTVTGHAEARVLKDGELIEVRLDLPDEAGAFRLVLLPVTGRGEPIVYPFVISDPHSPLPKR
jgi:anti-sigma factor RsiW